MARVDPKLQKLLDVVNRDPSPNNYCELVRHHLGLKDINNALLIAEKANKEFPESDQIFDLYYPLKKKKVEPEIKKLKEVISAVPQAAAYAQLAEIYKDLRREEQALKLCQQAIKQYPHDDKFYLIVGEIRLRRFYKNLLSRDGQICRENLEKAHEINPRNYKALWSLAKFYLQIGNISRAGNRLRSILSFAPDDDDVKRLLEICGKVTKPTHEDIDILLQTAEQERKLYYSLDPELEAARKIAISKEIFLDALDSIKNSINIVCLFVCDEEGNQVAHYAQDNIDINSYYEIASNIYQTIQISSKQMDIGRLQQSLIEGPWGIIYIISSDRIVYIGFGSVQTKAEVLYKELQSFIAKARLHAKFPVTKG